MPEVTVGQVWADLKRRLNKAEKAGNAEDILDMCDKAEKAFDMVGWPDWWSLIERMRGDAQFKQQLKEW